MIFFDTKAQPLDTTGVWAEEPARTDAKPKKSPELKIVVIFATAVLLVAIVGSVWAYMSGLQGLHFIAAQIVNKSTGSSARDLAVILEQANRWALKLALAAVASGAGLFTVAIWSSRWLWSNWSKGGAHAAEEANLRAHRLLGQLADARVSEEEARDARAAAEVRLAKVVENHGALERELEQRRETEKNLAQQTHQLERSKDVLEMHVQARTVELQKLQRRNELILNSAAEGICGFDLLGRATFVNPVAAKCTGWKIEELVGQSEDAIFFGNKARGGKDDGAKEGTNWLRDPQGQPLPEQIFFRKDGSSFPAEYVRTPIRENERIVGAVVTFKDITERRHAEDKLNQKAMELARSNRELEEFAYVASHDLQEPLRKIQAFGDRLKVKCETVQLDEGRDYLDRMQSAAARMQKLINDLLTFSRVISSSQPLVPVDLGAVTAEVLVDLEHRIEQTSANVQVSRLPTIQADPTQMRQLLQNLLGNALKFQAPGAVPSVKVEAQIITRDQIQEEAALPKRSRDAKPGDKFCLLTVQDNGIGFEEKYLEKVFTVFQRLHGRSEYEGTGVGLAVCRRISDRHGGLITAQSKLGEGSTFIVILPLQQPKSEEPQ
ncbi:MAG TPA: ATP-binding protein [Verrucomicrobiae bacterium]|jgi:two-component system sensor kinase FixL|nr:ATP-binding protein [Verrucomicrobiae bacterium]